MDARLAEKTRLKVTSAWPTTICCSTAPERDWKSQEKHTQVTGKPAACHPPFSLRRQIKTLLPLCSNLQSAHSLLTVSDQLAEGCGITLPLVSQEETTVRRFRSTEIYERSIISGHSISATFLSCSASRSRLAIQVRRLKGGVPTSGSSV